MRRTLIAALATAVVAPLLPVIAGAQPAAAAETTYWNITPITQGLDGQSFFPGDVNSSGQVVGTLKDSGGYSHPAVWQAGTLTMLPTPDGHGSAASINEAGYVAGDDYGANGAAAHAMRWSTNTLAYTEAGLTAGTAAAQLSGTYVQITANGDLVYTAADNTALCGNSVHIVPLDTTKPEYKSPHLSVLWGATDEYLTGLEYYDGGYSSCSSYHDEEHRDTGQAFLLATTENAASKGLTPDGTFAYWAGSPQQAYTQDFIHGGGSTLAGVGICTAYGTGIVPTDMNAGHDVVGMEATGGYPPPCVVGLLWPTEGPPKTLESLIPGTGWTHMIPYAIDDFDDIVGLGTYNGVANTPFLIRPGGPLTVTLSAPVAASGDLLSVRINVNNSSPDPIKLSFPSGVGILRDDTGIVQKVGLAPAMAPNPDLPTTVPGGKTVTSEVVFEITAPGSTHLATRVKGTDKDGHEFTEDATLRIDATPRKADEWEVRQAVAGAFTMAAKLYQDARKKAVAKLVTAVQKDLKKNPKTRGMTKPTKLEKAFAQQQGLPDNAYSWMSNDKMTQLIRNNENNKLTPGKPGWLEMYEIAGSEGAQRFATKLSKTVDNAVDRTLVTPGLFWRDYLRGVYNGQEDAINAEMADAASETWTKGTGLLAESAKFYADPNERQYLATEMPKIYAEASEKVAEEVDKTQVDLIKWDDLMQKDPRKGAKVFADKLADVEAFVAGNAVDDLFDPINNAKKAFGVLTRGKKAADAADVADAVLPTGEVTERMAQGGAQRIAKSGTAPARTPIKGMGNLNEDQLDFISGTADRVGKKFGVDIEIQARPVNAYSANIPDGIGKVEAVPTKNLTPDDVLMGAPDAWLGQTAYYKPKLPKGFNKLSAVDKERVKLRYDEKLDEFQKFKGLKPDPTGKADKVKKMLKEGGAEVDLGQNYKGQIELHAIEKEGATLIQYKKLVVNGKPVFTGKPRPIVSDIDFNAVIDRVTGKNLPAGIRGAVELELMNEFSKAQHAGLIPFGFHGWTHSGFDAKSQDFQHIAKYMLMYSTEEQARRFAEHWAPKFFPEIGLIPDPVKKQAAYQAAIDKILSGYVRGKQLVKITADGARIGPGVDPTIGLPRP